ncbi:MAG TPA: glycosyltransferase family 87 protein [Solirubrobacteraceae bacterium]|nr:glycosyltransferase family 87 protein [Solirubrobacteraceae bacterium]
MQNTTGTDAALPLPRARSGSARPLSARIAVSRPHVELRAAVGLIALALLIAGTVTIVLVASAGPTPLVPRSSISFPAWVAGPLHGLLAPITAPNETISDWFSVLAVAMLLVYGVVLVCVRAVGTRVVIGSVLVLHAVLLFSPPLQLEDVFNYLGYARLGALHGLNPYTHVMAQASLDPVYLLTTWHHLQSPYGPLFTAATYPLALLPLPVAYWVLKVATVLGSLGLLALCWRCARALGRDPRTVVAFVALNPIYLIWALGGFHNDVFMIDAALASVVLVLRRRDRAAGGALAVAIAIKFTAVLLLPFLLLAITPARRRVRLLSGLGLAAIPLIVLSTALFGFALPNLSTQSSLLTAYSVPNLLGDAIGAGGGAPWLLHLADAAVVLLVVWLVARRRDWLSGAGWATLALLLSLAWLVPWYLLWLLPLAALARSARLRAAALAMTVFLVISFVPWTGLVLSEHGVRTLTGSAGAASLQREASLQK